jgi:hypothetical protein
MSSSTPSSEIPHQETLAKEGLSPRVFAAGAGHFSTPSAMFVVTTVYLHKWFLLN